MRGLIHQKGGNSTYGNNRRFYWHNAKERGFYGNQHVKTVGLKTVGNGITKVSGSVGNLIDGYKIFTGYILDRHQMVYYTIRATAGLFPCIAVSSFARYSSGIIGCDGQSHNAW